MARVLIVEDEALVALMLEDFIREAGHEVFGVAGSLAQAGLLLASDTPDAALLDVRLGQELSYPIAAMLQDRGVRFMFMTAYDPAGDRCGVHLRCGLRKPVSPAVSVWR